MPRVAGSRRSSKTKDKIEYRKTEGESGCHQPLMACYECHGRAVIDSSYISGFEITQAHWSLHSTHHPALKAVYDRFLSQTLKTAWQTRHIPGTQCSRQLAPHNET